MVRVRRGCAVDLGRERAEAGLVRLHLARHRHREQRAPVERVVERDDRGPPCRPARDLHRVLDRFGARVHENRALLAATARRELREPPADLDVRLVDADHEALVEVAIGLLLDRLDDRRVPVPRVLAADPAAEVDEGAPVRIGDSRALGVGDDELRCRHARARRSGRGRRGSARLLRCPSAASRDYRACGPLVATDRASAA